MGVDNISAETKEHTGQIIIEITWLMPSREQESLVESCFFRVKLNIRLLPSYNYLRHGRFNCSYQTSFHFLLTSSEISQFLFDQ